MNQYLNIIMFSIVLIVLGICNKNKEKFGLKKNPIQSLGIINGRISKKKIGNKGFGYDPIFIPENKKLTFGQMSQKLKFKNDHRAQAFKKIKKFL